MIVTPKTMCAAVGWKYSLLAMLLPSNHSSISYTAYLLKVMGKQEPIPADARQEAGYSRRANPEMNSIHTYGEFRVDRLT